ncbi:Niacin transporter NiaP [Acetobacter malorum]|nr:Niacin transporter NiaP [Acetobacter malorum]
MTDSKTVSAFIDQCKLNIFHYRIFFIGGSGYFFDAMDVASISFILPVLKTQWHLSNVQLGAIGSATFVGYIIGALSAGTFADRYGRKNIMIVGLILYCLSAFFCALSGSFYQMLAARCFGGLGIGTESVIIAPFLTEFVPQKYRGRFAGGMSGFISLGFVAAAIVGYLTVPVSPSGWRIFFGICGLPLLLIPFWKAVLEESPVWLASRGRLPEAAEVLSRIYRKTINSTEIISDTKQLSLPHWGEFFRTQHSAMLATSGLSFFLMFGYYAFFTWLPQLLVMSGESVSSGIYASILPFAAQIPGYFGAAWLIDRLGALRVSAFFLVCSVLTALALSINPSVNMIKYSSILLALFVNGVMASAYAFIPFVYPARFRAMGTGMTASLGRTGAILAPILIGWIYNYGGSSGAFGLIATELCIAVILVLTILPQVKNY